MSGSLRFVPGEESLDLKGVLGRWYGEGGYRRSHELLKAGDAPFAWERE